MKSQLRAIDDHGVTYTALMFVCPACALNGSSGLHILPVNTTVKAPSWGWDGNYERPTISPSILTRGGTKEEPTICHSFLKDGWFDYLTDSTHKLAGLRVPIPDLPHWVARKVPDLKTILEQKARKPHGTTPG